MDIISLNQAAELVGRQESSLRAAVRRGRIASPLVLGNSQNRKIPYLSVDDYRAYFGMPAYVLNKAKRNSYVIALDNGKKQFRVLCPKPEAHVNGG